MPPTQELAAHKVPVAEGFRLGDDPALPPAASLAWSAHLQPGDALLLPVTFAPPRPAAAAQTLALRLDGRHVLQVRLVGTGAPPPAARAAKPRAPLARPAVGAPDVLREANRGPGGSAGASAAGSGDGAFKVPASRPRSAAQTPRGSAVGPGLAGAAPARTGPPARAGPAARAAGPPARGPPGPSGAPPASLRLKRAPAGIAAAAVGDAGGEAADKGAAGDQLEPPPETPRSQMLRARSSDAAASPASTPRAAATPRSAAAALRNGAAAPGALRSSLSLPRDGLRSLALRPGGAPSVAGSSSRGGRSSPGGGAPGTAGSTSKKARKTFSFFHTE